MWSSVDEIRCVLIWNDTSMTLLTIDSNIDFENVKVHYPISHSQICMCIY
jgi:hypothetical protein